MSVHAGDDPTPRAGEGGAYRKTPTQLAADPAFTGTYAGRRTALYADFVTASDGVPSAADSGQAWIHTTNGVANTALTVASGMLTNTATAASTAAGYLTASLGSTCRRIGADFSFNGGSSLGGGVVLATWKTPLPEGSIGAVPDAAVHLVMNPAAWTLGYFSGGSLTQIGTGSYRGGNLATNGTKYSADVVIDTTNATATLRLPDGQVIKFANAAFTTYAGAYPCIEVFQTLASTDDKPRIHGFWADNGAPYQRGFAATPADVSEALYKNYAATAPVTVLSSSAGSSLTGSLTDVDSTNLVLPQIIVPPSGKIMVDLSMWVEITTVGRLIWQLNLGGSPIGTAFVLNNLWKGYARYRYIFSGLTPGAAWGPYTWRHQLLDSGVGIVTVSGNNPAVMVATPVT